MSDTDLHTLIRQASVAIGSLAVLTSAIMYGKIRSLEKETDTIFERAKLRID